MGRRKRLFHCTSISERLTMLFAGTAAVTVVLVGATYLWSDVRDTRQDMERTLTGLARVLGANAAPALLFDDRAVATEILSSLEKQSGIVSACVYDADGWLFASYGSPPEGGAQLGYGATDGHRAPEGYMQVTSAINEGGETIGTISLCASLKELREGVLSTLRIVSFAVAGALVLSILLGARLQRAISRPILELADAAREVSENGDYAIRVTKTSDDEIGFLFDGFNEMLRQIQKRDRALELLAAIEQAAEAIFITDPDGTIEYINPAFQQVTGYTREEALGQTPRILKSGRHDTLFYRAMWDTLLRGEAWTGHVVNRRRDGTFYEAEATISPVRNTSGVVVKYVATQRDVTKEKEVEERLRQTQKLEAIGQLAGGIAHDLNNVLTVINGYSELLLERSKDVGGGFASSISEILAGGRRAADLVKQILAFSRKQPLQPKTLSVNDAASGLDAMLRTLLGVGEWIQLTLDLDPAVGMIEADPTQVEQVIMNLAVNARDAMPDGGRLTITTANAHLDEEYARSHPDVAAGDYVMLAVSDTGVGMGPDVLDRIFEPFFTTKGLGKGTGLGLSTVYGIVKQSGGEVEVQSRPGEGTTFRVYLPVAGGSPKSQPVGFSGEGKRTGTETVLLVEDEPLVRSFLSRVLRDLGYTVIEAANGDEAVAAARSYEGPIHLALADVMMPVMTGPELAGTLQSLRPGTRIMYMSGYPDCILRRGARVPEGAALLAKPIGVDELAEALRKVLSGPPGTARTAQ